MHKHLAHNAAYADQGPANITTKAFFKCEKNQKKVQVSIQKIQKSQEHKPTFLGESDHFEKIPGIKYFF